MNINDPVVAANESRAQMRVGEAIDLCRSAEAAILKVLTDLSDRTGLHVGGVALVHRMHEIDGRVPLAKVSIKVQL